MLIRYYSRLIHHINLNKMADEYRNPQALGTKQGTGLAQVFDTDMTQELSGIRAGIADIKKSKLAADKQKLADLKLMMNPKLGYTYWNEAYRKNFEPKYKKLKD